MGGVKAEECSSMVNFSNTQHLKNKRRKIMKRTSIWLVILLVFSFNLFGRANAAEEKDKVTGFIILKGDVYVPHVKNRNAYTFQRVNLYARYKLVGAGLDVEYIKKLDFMRVRPYLTANLGSLPIYLTFGYQSVTGKSNTSHVQTGIGINKSWGKWNGYIDARNYRGIDKKSISFIENWFGLYRSIGQWYFGGETCYTHWWQDKSHDSVLAGPVIGYRFTENISASVRFARYWDIKPIRTTTEDGVQLRVKYSF
jgi:hypothetical protein